MGKIRIAITLLLILSSSDISFSQNDEFDEIFFLSIGNENYIDNQNKYISSFNGYPKVRGANNSAKLIANFIEQRLKGKGITLLSRKDRILTNSLIQNNFDKIIKTVEESTSEKPLVIIYYIGHSASIEETNMLGLVPGNYLTFNDSNEIENNVIFTSDLAMIMYEKDIDFLFLIDACYDYNELTSNFYLESKNSKYLDSVRNTKSTCELGPVVYATNPGNLARTYKNPIDYSGVSSVGAICKSFIADVDLPRTARLSLNHVVKAIILSSERYDFDNAFYTCWDYSKSFDSVRLLYHYDDTSRFRHIGKWEGKNLDEVLVKIESGEEVDRYELILNIDGSVDFLRNNEAYLLENGDSQNQSLVTYYQIDYSEYPISIDFIIYDSDKDKELKRFRGIVEFPMYGGFINLVLNIKGQNRPENFDEYNLIQFVNLQTKNYSSGKD